MEIPGSDSAHPLSVKALEVCRLLNEAGARYLVIGGIACILHGRVRLTTDIDILIERSPENVKFVLEALSQTGYGFVKEWSPEEILARPITIIGDDPAVDIFLVAWSVKYETAVDNAVVVSVRGVDIPLIGLDDLIATKRTGRAIDTDDIHALEEIRRYQGGSAT